MKPAWWWFSFVLLLGIPSSACLFFVLAPPFLGFVRSPLMLDVMPLIVVVYAAALSGFYLAATSEFRKGKRRKREILLNIAVPLMFGYTFINFAWPVAGYFISSDAGHVMSTISEVDLHPGRRSLCAGKAEVRVEYDSGFLAQMCVPRTQARQLSPGSKVKLSGRSAQWGFYVQEIELVR